MMLIWAARYFQLVAQYFQQSSAPTRELLETSFGIYILPSLGTKGTSELFEFFIANFQAVSNHFYNVWYQQ